MRSSAASHCSTGWRAALASGISTSSKPQASACGNWSEIRGPEARKSPLNPAWRSWRASEKPRPSVGAGESDGDQREPVEKRRQLFRRACPASSRAASLDLATSANSATRRTAASTICPRPGSDIRPARRDPPWRHDDQATASAISLKADLNGARPRRRVGFDETLAGLAACEIDGDDALDGLRNTFRRAGPAPAVRRARKIAGVAANGDLVGFGALLLQAENADGADMVMAAGVDAAGDLDLSSPISFWLAGSAKVCAIACATGIERAVASRNNRGRGRQ